jgi:hypothetical protein
MLAPLRVTSPLMIVACHAMSFLAETERLEDVGKNLT